MTGVGGVPDAASRPCWSTSRRSARPRRRRPAGLPGGRRTLARRTSNLNVRRGQTVPVLALAKVGRDGRIALSTSSGSTHVVLDVVGWVRSGQG